MQPSSRPLPPPRNKRYGCLILFFAPFAVVGTAVGAFSWLKIAEWLQMQRWVEVPAKIRSAELKAQHDRGQVVYTVEVEYEYRFGGRQFVSRRVWLHDLASNRATLPRSVLANLKEHVRKDKPFRCFVHPRQPSRAVLFREIRADVFHVYTVLVLGAGGLGYLMAGYWWCAARSARRRMQISADYPHQPWRWHPDWVTSEIPSSYPRRVPALAGLCIFLMAATLPAVLASLWENRPFGACCRMVAAFYVVAIATVMGWLILIGARQHKYGRSFLQLDREFVIPGAPMVGTIHIDRNASGLERVVEHLECRSVRSPPSDVTATIQWERTRVVTRCGNDDAFRRGEIPVRFQAPLWVEETSFGDDDPREVHWSLLVRGVTKGFDYCGRFRIPVFRRAGERSEAGGIRSGTVASETIDEALAQARIRCERANADSITFIVFPAPLKRYYGVPMAMAGLAILALLMAWDGWPVQIVFGCWLLFGLPISVFGLPCFQTQRIETSPEGIRVERRTLGLCRCWTVPAGEVTEIETKCCGGFARQVFEVLARRVTDRPVVIARDIDGREAADIVAEEIRQRIASTGRNVLKRGTQEE